MIIIQIRSVFDSSIISITLQDVQPMRRGQMYVCMGTHLRCE
jgi:hypothetical protein